MLTIISGNNRDGYPCALNKVSDIFQCGIPPIETEGLIDLGYASQKEAFSLAGSLSLIFNSTKVTASGDAGVTVSMTSEDSAGYGKWELCSSLAKVRKCNLINWLKTDDSGFLQTVRKEKGPRPALRVMQLLTCEEANELHHNSYLQATGNLSYSRRQHLNKTGAGPASPNTRADISRYKRFFCVRNQRCAPIMVGRSGGALALAGFSSTGLAALLRLATLPASGERGLKEPTREAATMATAQTRPEFIDTYWIIPEYSSEPYGKVSFTRQDRRTFIALFKDSRLIWAGRQPVQGRVKITPPSVITNIVTVQGVAHV